MTQPQEDALSGGEGPLETQADALMLSVVAAYGLDVLTEEERCDYVTATAVTYAFIVDRYARCRDGENLGRVSETAFRGVRHDPADWIEMRMTTQERILRRMRPPAADSFSDYTVAIKDPAFAYFDYVLEKEADAIFEDEKEAVRRAFLLEKQPEDDPARALAEHHAEQQKFYRHQVEDVLSGLVRTVNDEGMQPWEAALSAQSDGRAAPNDALTAIKAIAVNLCRFSEDVYQAGLGREDVIHLLTARILLTRRNGLAVSLTKRLN